MEVKEGWGGPTVSDRIAQTVARMYFEPVVEPRFHPDSYGYRLLGGWSVFRAHDL